MSVAGRSGPAGNDRYRLGSGYRIHTTKGDLIDMSNETRAKIVKAAPNRWLVFCILTLSGGIAFKLSSMKDMFLSLIHI